MSTVDDGLFQFGGSPVGISNFTKVIHCKPGTGSDGADGLTPLTAVATVAKAHTLLTADKNEAVFLYAEDNSASGTTDYQSATLTWSKDGTHLVGLNSLGFMGQRSRIAQLSTATGVTPLVDITASNCSWHNIHVFHGVADAASLIAVQMTGERNLIQNCHFAGMGNDSQDASGGRSLKLNAAAETLFKNCVIGLDTITRGTSEAEMEFVSAVTRVKFEDCTFPTNAAAAGFTYIKADTAGAIDRFVIFKDCLFVNAVNSGATEMTEAFDTHASLGGSIIIQNSGIVGVGAAVWDASTDGVVYNTAPDAGANGDGGHAEAVN